MKKLPLVLIVWTLLIFSCSESEEDLQPTGQFVTLRPPFDNLDVAMLFDISQMDGKPRLITNVRKITFKAYLTGSDLKNEYHYLTEMSAPINGENFLGLITSNNEGLIEMDLFGELILAGTQPPKLSQEPTDKWSSKATLALKLKFNYKSQSFESAVLEVKSQKFYYVITLTDKFTIANNVFSVNQNDMEWVIKLNGGDQIDVKSSVVINVDDVYGTTFKK